MKVFATLLLAVASQAAPAPEADPLLYTAGYPYAGVYGGYGYPYAAVAPVHTALTYSTAVQTGNAVPVAVGGYKAEAGCNGPLCGPVHAVPAVFGALATETQESSGAVKLTTGTGQLVATPVVSHYIGKREADAQVVAAPAVVSPLVYGGYPYAGAYAGVGYPYAAYPYAVPHVVPATKEVTYKTYTPTVETNVVATNQAVPVAVGGYKAVAGDNGELKGAVHEVPAIFGAPALNVQTNDASQGSLAVGTSAFVTHTVGEPIVKEHTVQVPTFGVHFGKRDAEPKADADPYLLYGNYGTYGYGLGHGYGYGHGLGYGHLGYGYGSVYGLHG